MWGGGGCLWVCRCVYVGSVCLCQPVSLQGHCPPTHASPSILSPACKLTVNPQKPHPPACACSSLCLQARWRSASASATPACPPRHSMPVCRPHFMPAYQPVSHRAAISSGCLTQKPVPVPVRPSACRPDGVQLLLALRLPARRLCPLQLQRHRQQAAALQHQSDAWRHVVRCGHPSQTQPCDSIATQAA